MHYFSFCFTNVLANIDNNNRGTERFVGKLKGVVNGFIRDDKDNLNITDMRILATLQTLCAAVAVSLFVYADTVPHS